MRVSALNTKQLLMVATSLDDDNVYCAASAERGGGSDGGQSVVHTRACFIDV